MLMTFFLCLQTPLSLQLTELKLYWQFGSWNGKVFSHLINGLTFKCFYSITSPCHIYTFTDIHIVLYTTYEACLSLKHTH